MPDRISGASAAPKPTGAPAAPTRVLIVDDHPMLREGIAAVIGRQADMAIVGEAANGVEAIEQYRAGRPDVTLMDIQMPGMGGLEAIQRIRAEDGDAAIVVLTTYPGDTQALRALRAGAAGYLLKSCIRKDLLDTIRTVHAGRRAIAPEIAQEIALHALDEKLTERETDILRLVAEGHPNKQVAWRLSLSTDTVKAHLKNIFAKLDVADRTQAVITAARRGFIDI
ncbi:response regulator [Sphingomonas sp. MMS12-HWE2-04]|uniref:response regulator n=1 Tax=Sphingomonas sp. MMS12-HWE2-04 TaxID=3234199 RepID=UPI00384F351E